MSTKEEQATQLLAELISNLIKNNNTELIDSLPFDRTYIGRIVSYEGDGKYKVVIGDTAYIVPYLMGEDWTIDKKSLLNLEHCHIIPNFLKNPEFKTTGTPAQQDAIDTMGNYYVTSPPTQVAGEVRTSHTPVYIGQPAYWKYVEGKWKSDVENDRDYTEQDIELKSRYNYHPKQSWEDGNTDVGEYNSKCYPDKDIVFRSSTPLSVNTKVVVKAPQNNKSNMYIEGRLSV